MAIKVEYIVSGISGGFADYYKVHDSFRSALEDFIERGYADHLNAGDVRIRITAGDVVYCTKLCFFTDSVCGYSFPRSIFYQNDARAVCEILENGKVNDHAER